MREILFRGKRVDGGEWVYGAFCPKSYDLPFGPMVDRPSIIKLEYPCSGCWADVIPETVGQYTGLTDKNGKKIFEGDIMQFNAYGHRYVGFVEYGDAEFGVDCKNASPFLSTAVIKYGVTVIGNIHDNLELLGGADNGE